MTSIEVAHLHLLLPHFCLLRPQLVVIRTELLESDEEVAQQVLEGHLVRVLLEQSHHETFYL